MVQYLADDGLADQRAFINSLLMILSFHCLPLCALTPNFTDMIACTQPRKLAARTVAQRVAEEWNCKFGTEVQSLHPPFIFDSLPLTPVYHSLGG